MTTTVEVGLTLPQTVQPAALLLGELKERRARDPRLVVAYKDRTYLLAYEDIGNDSLVMAKMQGVLNGGVAVGIILLRPPATESAMEPPVIPFPEFRGDARIAAYLDTVAAFLGTAVPQWLN